MGSEQSSQQQHMGRQQRINQQRNSVLGRSRSREVESREDDGPASSGSEFARPGSISPGPSICSDSDLPYISYTVNRPIGDSPKLPHKHLQQGHGSRSKLVGQSTRKSLSRKTALVRSNITSGHNIVVVKPAVNTEPVEKDPDLVRLQSVPMFLPIMRGTLNLPAARDPEVLERLDPSGLLALCHRYQQHIAISAQVVASEQVVLTARVREVDAAISAMIDRLVERQRKFARYAERLAKVHDVSHQLNRCHALLNQTLESLDSLNNSLPVAERLEPFVWTTG